MPDDMFESDCEALVNTVNCVGVMGGGLAAQFRSRYPVMNNLHEQACREGRVKTGEVAFYLIRNERIIVVNFPTKRHWKDPSELEWVKDGLADLRDKLLTTHNNIKSIAVPALGCGLGGLDWADVEPLIAKYLEDLPLRVEVYPPYDRKYVL